VTGRGSGTFTPGGMLPMRLATRGPGSPPIAGRTHWDFTVTVISPANSPSGSGRSDNTCAVFWVGLTRLRPNAGELNRCRLDCH